MTYAISNLPFPSVVLCPNDRVDWNRALELERTIFPNDTADRASLETFRKILGNLSALTFGDFDKLDFLNDENENIRGLSGRISPFLSKLLRAQDVRRPVFFDLSPILDYQRFDGRCHRVSRDFFRASVYWPVSR